eukprot:TRINITY_DN232_c0_g1_i1.p2 TRINITY_DN232_c0_g1~~TRINITY_DN232_c0_g1_i1.p2  ORF type:complete len:353 (-),score=153.21 TRINITY_DN232_c0_g1_i1:74-1111(-)
MDKAELQRRWSELTAKNYSTQAKFWLNAFWNYPKGGQTATEEIWKWVSDFVSLDLQKRKEGNQLDEFNAHRFLEVNKETMTVVAMREMLSKMGLEKNKQLALVEYMLVKFNPDCSLKDLLTNPQGDNKAEVDAAQQKLNAVQESLRQLEEKLENQRKAVVAQKEAEENARLSLANQKAAEEQVKKAEAENQAAVDELHMQEQTYQDKISTLEAKANDASATTVSRSRAANELAQVKGEDPLPLRKAKITQEAALRKVQKERKAAEAATAVAEQKIAQAEEATKQAEHQAQLVEQAVGDAQTKVDECIEFLEEVKRKGGASLGDFWWMDREIKEAQKFLPQRKQQH